jgi:hypothetical protein
VFARRVVQSDASWGFVDKLGYPFTGPWHIIANLYNALYEIDHCSTKKWEKWHAPDLSSYPVELLPLHPLDGADNQYGQIHKKILDDPYIQAGIKGFEPPTPFGVYANLLTTNTGRGFSWPTLAKLNGNSFHIYGLLAKNLIHTWMTRQAFLHQDSIQALRPQCQNTPL